MKVGLMLMLLLFLPNSVLACRCAEQPLAEYFAHADEVFIGTLLQTQSLNEDERQFLFERHGLPYKRQSRSTSQLPYVSNKSTAACAVAVAPGEIDADAVMIGSYDDLQHRESGYEVDAALVYAVIAGWHKVQLQEGGFGWLAPDAAGTYWPLETLLPNRLTYFAADWNRLIWPDIGGGVPRRVSFKGEQPPREQAVKIISSQRLAQSLWFEVEVLQDNACEGKSEKILANGWVPAYTELGEPVVWFYSRGC